MLFVSIVSSRCPQDMSSRLPQDMSSRRLQRNNFSSSKTSSRRLARYLQNVFARRLQDVLADVKLLRWRRVEDLFKFYCRRFKKFVISQEKTCVGVFCNKVAGPQNSNFIEKRLQHRFFSSEICKIFKNTLFYRSPAAASGGLRFPACTFVKKETASKMFFLWVLQNF